MGMEWCVRGEGGGKLKAGTNRRFGRRGVGSGTGPGFPPSSFSGTPSVTTRDLKDQGKLFWAGVRAMPVLLSVAGGLITGTASATLAAYGYRDAERERTAALVRAAANELRAEHRAELGRYVSREELWQLLDQRFDRFESRILERLRTR